MVDALVRQFAASLPDQRDDAADDEDEDDVGGPTARTGPIQTDKRPLRRGERVRKASVAESVFRDVRDVERDALRSSARTGSVRTLRHDRSNLAALRPRRRTHANLLEGVDESGARVPRNQGRIRRSRSMRLRNPNKVCHGRSSQGEQFAYRFFNGGWAPKWTRRRSIRYGAERLEHLGRIPSRACGLASRLDERMAGRRVQHDVVDRRTRHTIFSARPQVAAPLPEGTSSDRGQHPQRRVASGEAAVQDRVVYMTEASTRKRGVSCDAVSHASGVRK